MRGERELSILRDKAVENLNLPRNRAKAHWSELSKPRILWLLSVEVLELVAAVWVLHRAQRRYRAAVIRRLRGEVSLGYTVGFKTAVADAKAEVAHEAADVNCFAMMIATNCNAL